VQYVIAGLVLGGIYALAASGLVVTYTSTGILNFAFGSEAYVLARLYYYLHTQQRWPTAGAAILCVLVIAPALGVLLYAVLFRFLQFTATLTKIVATVGLSVCLPALAVLAFGNTQIFEAPGFAPQPEPTIQILGAAVTLDQIIVLITVVVFAVAGAIVLRFTDVGLATRALVDSPAMTILSGTNPGSLSVGVWAVSTLLAGLTGILLSPVVGLSSSENFTVIISSALAAVVAAKLRFLWRAVVVSLLLGVGGGVIQALIPPSTVWSTTAVQSIPFVVTAGFLLYYARGKGVGEVSASGGALDHAIAIRAVSSSEPLSLELHKGLPTKRFSRFVKPGDIGGLVIVGLVAILPLVLSGIWIGFVGLGAAYAVAFLSYTVLTGEGAIISLCLITFAGIGGLLTAQLATDHHWPILLAFIAAGVVGVPIGVVLGFISIRLGGLYFALATLTFGVLMDNIVFTLNIFTNFGDGTALTRPSFATSSVGFAYFGLAIFAILALFVVNLRRSTAGLTISAVRWSEAAARTSGISVSFAKIRLMAIAAFIAGLGGALLAMSESNATPSAFATETGFVWLAILVTVGVRSNVATLLAGMLFAFIPALFTSYLPTSLAEVPTALFGLGAILAAKNPDGVLSLHAAQLRNLARVRRQHVLTGEAIAQHALSKAQATTDGTRKSA
jgi:branched-chain amino acid transport system permease protein